MDIIVTPRLVLRTPLGPDLRALHDHVLSDPDVMRLAFSGVPLSFEQSEAFFHESFDHDRTGRKLGMLVERDTGRILGFAGLLPCDALGRPDYELGFVLRRDAWGRGYAAEIGRGQVAHALDTLGLPRVLAQVSPQNHRSIATLQKLGMVLHGTVRNDVRGERLVYAAVRQRAEP